VGTVTHVENTAAFDTKSERGEIDHHIAVRPARFDLDRIQRAIRGQQVCHRRSVRGIRAPQNDCVIPTRFRCIVGVVGWERRARSGVTHVPHAKRHAIVERGAVILDEIEAVIADEPRNGLRGVRLARDEDARRYTGLSRRCRTSG
jgi:hypothetical protein